MRRAATIAAEGLRHLVRHPLRNLLTAATCAVAIAVTVNVISLVYGLEADLTRDTERLGRRTVDISRFPVLMPGLVRGALGPEQRTVLEEHLADLDVTVVPRRMVAGRVAGDGPPVRHGVVGVETGYLRTIDVAVLEGRWLHEGDPVDGVCVLDRSAGETLFRERPPGSVVGQTVRIEIGDREQTCRVVGVLEDPISQRRLFETFDEGRGARTLTSSLLSFRNVYVPIDALPGPEFSGISVVAPDDEMVGEVARRLREIWPSASEDPFESLQSVGVFVRRDWMDLFGKGAQTGALLSNIVWMIIVGVAIVMISTLNLLTIRERYDELAIRRVEGAGRDDVALQITVEGVVTALLGGLAGLPLGYLGADLLRRMVDFPFRFEARYALWATGIAVVLGLLASVLPARRAATLQPARVLTRRLT